RPVAATAARAEQPRMERLAPADGHVHPAAGRTRFSAAARSRDDSLRVHRYGCLVQATGPPASAQGAGRDGKRFALPALTRDLAPRAGGVGAKGAWEQGPRDERRVD